MSDPVSSVQSRLPQRHADGYDVMVKVVTEAFAALSVADPDSRELLRALSPVAWDTDFIGRKALPRRREAGIKSRMTTLTLDDPEAIPLGNEPIYFGGRIIGQTTSAAFGYRIGKPVAFAYLNTEALTDPEEAEVQVDVARTLFKARATLTPAFHPAGSRMKV